MDEFIGLIVVVALVIAGVLFLTKRNKTLHPDASHAKTNTIIIDEIDEGPEPFDHEAPSGEIVTIYKYSSVKDVWACPVCEVENPDSAESCFLCGHVR